MTARLRRGDTRDGTQEMTAVPPITIGLPVYNGENYVDQSIRCLRDQTFGDFRLIISDNASTDSTEEIARSAALEDERIIYHRQPVNLGGPANYNFTLAQAAGDFFMWHAHDDLRDPRFLELAYAHMGASRKTSVTFSRASAIGPDGEELGPMFRPAGLIHHSAHRRLRAVIGAPRPELVLFGLMRRELLEQTRKHGSFKGGDRILVAEMALLGDFHELDDVLFQNRDHPDRYTRMSTGPGAERKRREWWDPTRPVDTISMPRWRGFREYLAAIRRHPLTSAERIRCYIAMFQSLFDNRMYLAKQLAREPIGVVPNVISRVSGR